MQLAQEAEDGFPRWIKLDQSQIVKGTSAQFFQVSLICICILPKAFKKQLSFIQGCRCILNTVFGSTRSPTLSETRRLVFSMHAAGVFSMLRIFKANYFSSLFFFLPICVFTSEQLKRSELCRHAPGWIIYKKHVSVTASKSHY